METWGCCKTIMMGYVGIALDFVSMDINYIMLDYDFDPRLCLCTGCWEEPSLSPGMLKRTLSHIWLRLYIQMFWFNAGLFTLMKIDSLMVLACPWSSLPMMLKLSSVVLCPVCCMCMWWGRVVLGVPCIFLQGSWLSPLCFIHHKLCDCTGNCRWPHSSFP